MNVSDPRHPCVITGRAVDTHAVLVFGLLATQIHSETSVLRDCLSTVDIISQMHSFTAVIFVVIIFEK